MARGGVTYFEVRKAAKAIEDAGKYASIERVRQKLGTGSYSTLAPLVKRYHEERSGSNNGIPSALTDALKDIFIEAKNEAQVQAEEAKAEYEKQRVALENANAVLRSQNTELNSKLAHAEAEIRELRNAKEGLQGQLLEANVTLSAESSKVDGLIERLQNRETALHEKQTELDRQIDNHLHYQQEVRSQREAERQSHRQAIEAQLLQVKNLEAQLQEMRERNRQLEETIEEHALNIEELEEGHSQAAEAYDEVLREHGIAKNQILDLKERLLRNEEKLEGLQSNYTKACTDAAAAQAEAEFARNGATQLKKTIERLRSELDEQRKQVRKQANGKTGNT
tara:strand:- start:1824 stop:2837 length:1014 start_codon:yes stop_codon:yes gene_type:complete